LSGAVLWLNSPPLSPQELRGKVVVVDFWTYSCINCLRSLPYVRAWSEKYKDQGLVVIGVHTPEFAFEKNTDNVKNAVADLKIDFPMAIDNDTQSGGRSRTTIGRPIILSMRKAASVTMRSVRATTRPPSMSSSSFLPGPAVPVYPAVWWR
jgi:thiol-disulfide isomerase/thioredoxin